ncbi:hypothetical protein DJ521_02165 [Sulfolobus sp. E3]|nr:hypothetical protein DJ521_02165 [Sulfolobus sp. E3]
MENKLKKNLIKEVHKAAYEILKEKFNLHPKLAQGYYRDAIVIYKGWLKNPKEVRYPRIRKVSVRLTPYISYKLDFERMVVWTRVIGELPILGYPRNLSLYLFPFKVYKC